MSITGIITNYKRFAVHDGDGIRTTLFLKGCPLSCRWCHNPEGIAPKPELAYLAHKCIGCGECQICPAGAHSFENAHTFHRERCIACGECTEVCLGDALTLYGKKITAEEAARELLLDKSFYDESGGGITLSGGEPLMQPRFTAEVFRLCQEAGVRTALDTCGFASREALDLVLPHTDKVQFDIKAARSETHERFTGRPNERIIENLHYINKHINKHINKRGIPVEIRIPLIPGVNDGELDEIGRILAPLEVIAAVRVLPYHGYAKSKYESLGMHFPGESFTSPDAAAMNAAKATLEQYGLTVIVPDRKE